MSQLTVYALGSCDTCRKALVDLRDAGHDPIVVDVRADGVARAVLDRLVAQLGTEALVNRRSATWRGLDAGTHNRAMDAATAADVLSEHPTLMKRPVIVRGGTAVAGWTPAVRAALAI